MATSYVPLLTNHFGQFNQTKAADLYPDTDFDGLNVLERLWVSWYVWIGNPVIATGLMSFLLHEVVYFGRCIPWMIIDRIPYFRQWKLQPEKVPTKAQMWKCTKAVLFSHFTIELPQIWGFHPLAEYFGLATHQVPFPSWKLMAIQIAMFFVFEDMFHYFAHRALHYGPLYKHIHKMHHEYAAPFGLAAEYAHPLEVLILGTGTIGGPLLYCLARPDLHIFTVYVWVTLRLFQAVDAHSGYDFPWSLQHIIPFWSGADHHDFHHMAFVNNYSTSFRWWDHMLGTDNKYRAYKKRVAAARPEERVALEKKELEKVEREGLKAERLAERGAGKGGMEGVPKGKLE
ncbi:hypothetical protein NliqN6_6869 [Naganishia liquefaciens]|uniref:Fatty acid hydroxylase domain-containing protein n=1 Tax=Naganishia liquefaciens TaxID=104408 RepID=A0A8H3U0H8_9TREE|nr:hypothetical protein NliqN6_6869 [Naganishia liquefaciens]